MTRLIRTCDSRTVLLSLAGQCCEDVCWTGLDPCVGTSASRINSPHRAAVRCVFLSGSPAQRLLGQRPQHKQCDRIKPEQCSVQENCPAKVPKLESLYSSSQIQKETQRQWKLLNGSPASVCRHTSIHHTPVTRVHITLMFQVSKAVILFYFGSWWNKCFC